jgi:hypothetical protein
MHALRGRRAAFLGFVALAIALGTVPWISVPLGWYETLFHETSHGIAAVATGGRMSRLVLRGDGSGTMWTAGGIRAVVLFCGYLGAVAWGGALYVGGSSLSRTGASRLCLAIAAIAAAEVAFLARDAATIGILAVLAVPPALVSRPWSAAAAPSFLRLVGAACIVSGMRAPTFVLAAGAGDSDAKFLRDMTAVPMHAWVGAWLACGALATLAVWRAEARADREGGRDRGRAALAPGMAG